MKEKLKKLKINLSEFSTAESGQQEINYKDDKSRPSVLYQVLVCALCLAFHQTLALKKPFLFKVLKATAVLITGFGNHYSKPSSKI